LTSTKTLWPSRIFIFSTQNIFILFLFFSSCILKSVYILFYTQTHTRTHTSTDTHTHAHAHTHAPTRTRTHAHTHTHAHAHAHTCTHMHMHAHTRTRTHTHTHTHTHALGLSGNHAPKSVIPLLRILTSACLCCQRQKEVERTQRSRYEGGNLQ
jgi:hypothetical protein